MVMDWLQRCKDRFPASGGKTIGEASCRSVWSRLAAARLVEKEAVFPTG
jgi:hypothetical protein